MNTFTDSFETVKLAITNKDYGNLSLLLTKLNNPVFFTKFLYSSPQERYDYPNSKAKNPWRIATEDMLQVSRDKSLDDDTKHKKLETAVAWLFNNPERFYFIK
jgi:hypothetical protein